MENDRIRVSVWFPSATSKLVPARALGMLIRSHLRRGVTLRELRDEMSDGGFWNRNR